MKNKALVRSAAFASVAVLTASGLSGCADRNYPSTWPIVLDASLDNSGSDRRQLPLAVFALSHSLSVLDPQSDRLVVWRTSHSSQCFFDGPKPTAINLQAIAIEALEPSPKRGTDPRAYFAAAATYETPMVAAAFGDGDVDEYGGRVEVTKSLALLSRNGRAFVVLAGVRPENWAFWQDATRAFGCRAQILGPGESATPTIRLFVGLARQSGT